MDLLFLLTIDCDLRVGNIPQRGHSLFTLLEVFDREGLSGHITWFLNENDFQITTNHPDFLEEVLRRGDTVGVHDHYEPLQGQYTFARVREYSAKSKERVEKFLKSQDQRDAEVIAHRNGCLVQNQTIYEALCDLGYKMASEIYPGKKGEDLNKLPAFDNSDIPIELQSYRHDPSNFSDCLSRKGALLHIPVLHLMIDFDFSRLDMSIDKCRARRIDTCIACWDFHPYEIQSQKGEVDKAKTELLRDILRKLKSDYSPHFVGFEEYYRMRG